MRGRLHLCWILAVCVGGSVFAAEDTLSNAPPTFRQYCFSCHGKAALAGVSLQQLTSSHSMGDNFQQWEKVATELEAKRMPPAKLPQPSEAERRETVKWIRAKLNDFAQKHAGDPGRVTVRRLTSGEYTYAIQDLTGLDLKFDRDFASDSVGGEGFTNFGDVQFMEDANLERYLDAAKRVAGHAVVGSGPLGFFEHPGKSGLELSAVNRIQEIYRANGFRAVAGEGAKPYGLERYAKAFYVAWRYLHRQQLGEGAVTLETIAAREGLSPRFARHIWSLLRDPAPAYPVADVVTRWRSLPVPTSADDKQAVAAARNSSEELQRFVIDWPRWLFAAGPMESAVGDDRVFLLNDESLKVSTSQTLKFLVRGRNQKTVRLYLTVASMNPAAKDKPVVTWRNGTVRGLRGRPDRTQPAAQQESLKSLLGDDAVSRLKYGQSPDGGAIDAGDFATASGSSVFFDVPVPQGALGLELQLTAEIPSSASGDAVIRVTISDREEVSKGRTTPALLGNPGSAGYQSWKTGVMQFADRFPQNSHGEPTPSDRDPIPPPFNTAYNQPERDRFHTKVKYYRTDRFLVDKILDDATRLKLDQAWNDLLSSFDYHDVFLRFVADKYQLDIGKRGIADFTEAQLAALPAEPQKYVRSLRNEYLAVLKTQRVARPGHVEDCVRLAGKAWRRPLSKVEEDGLRAFYRKTAAAGTGFDHGTAIRSLLARILIAPAFLYRLEQPGRMAADRPLTDWELASRMSFFLWSSIPDDELRRAAAAGELSNPQQLDRQVKRMLADTKSRRLSTEFFGQWLGFYRFDQYRGVDTTRFPEFTDDVKSAMYDEAVSFFEHIVRKDRPIREMLSADYTFVNQTLAKHYGLKKEIKSKEDPELVDGANAFQRGGLLRLGAVLTATSAPLRTSPVKRGDWVLRRVLGTPTPPPPADAGSIPADEKSFGGLTVFERLEVHKRNPTCASCHTRIDPLGFPLERYDAVGRWRETYSDGKPVHDSATLADKTPIAGVGGLLTYLKAQEPQVLKTFSYKLLGYALGRTVLISDQPLVERLTNAGGDATFSKLATEIVLSRQFRYRRERDDSPPATPQHAAQQSAERPAVKRVSGSEKTGGL